MSQIIEVKPEERITDIAALRSAAKDLGLELTEKGQVRYYFGTKEADYVLKLPGRYDLGFVKQPDGSYQFLADNELIGGKSGTDGYGRADAGRKVLGENCQNLYQRYRYRQFERRARERGLSVTERGRNERGDLLLEVQQYGRG
jgi:hypothetical protein